MSNYVLVFRGGPGRVPSAAEEAEWTAWFTEIGRSIADFGNRVSRSTAVGGDSPDAVAGYIVISADSLEAAEQLALGCPALRQGGRVEIGEVMAA